MLLHAAGDDRSIDVLQTRHSSLRPVLGDKTHGPLKLINDGIYTNTLPRNLLSLSLSFTWFLLLVLGVQTVSIFCYICSTVKVRLVGKRVLNSNVYLY